MSATRQPNAHEVLRARLLREIDVQVTLCDPPGDPWAIDAWRTPAEERAGTVGIISHGRRVASGLRKGEAAHMVQHSPQAMLRRYLALGAVIAAHESFTDPAWSPGGDGPMWTCRVCDSCSPGPCGTLRGLAAMLLTRPVLP